MMTGFACQLVAQNFSNENNQENNKRGKERIKALYIAFITQELNLNVEESEKFWPVHLQYDAELKNARKNNLNELDKEESELLIRKKYVPKFSKIIGQERTNLFYKKDKEFRNKLVEKLKNQRMKNKAEFKKNNEKFENHP